MRKLMAFSLVLAMLLTMVFPVSAAESGSQPEYTNTYEWSIGNSSIVITYAIKDDGVVIEKSEIYEGGHLETTYVKYVTQAGVVTIYQNETLLCETTGDYAEYVAFAKGTVEVEMENASGPATRETYQVCGSTLPHTLVDKTTERIKVSDQNWTKSGTSLIAGYLISGAFGGAWGAVYSVASWIASNISPSKSQYIDVTRWQYFVTDYTLMQSYTCYHTYLVFYNDLDGTKQVVATKWDCYRILL